jgi:hypothetical protein
MADTFFDAEIRMNEYWPTAKVNWKGKLNIQHHIAKVNDYDNSVIGSMIQRLDDNDQMDINALIMFDSAHLYHPGMNLSVAMDRCGDEVIEEMI